MNDFRVWGGRDEALCKIDTSKLFSYVTTCSTVTKPLKFKVSIFPFDLLTQFISGTGKRRGNFIDILKIAVVSQTRHHIIKMEKRGVDFSWSQGKTVTKNLQPNLRIFQAVQTGNLSNDKLGVAANQIIQVVQNEIVNDMKQRKYNATNAKKCELMESPTNSPSNQGCLEQKGELKAARTRIYF